MKCLCSDGTVKLKGATPPVVAAVATVDAGAALASVDYNRAAVHR